MKILPFYLVLFQDFEAAERKLAEIKAAVFPETELTSFNDNVLFGPETGSEQIIALCRTVPFGGGRRFVLVRQAEKLVKEERAELFEYLKKPSRSAVLVLFFQTDAKARYPFAGHQIKLFFSGEEAELANNFGMVNALRRRNLKQALKILNSQYGGERDFPRFFGVLAWYLRDRMEKQGRITVRDANLLERFYGLERNFRRGKLTGQLALEMALIALNE